MSCVDVICDVVGGDGIPSFVLLLLFLDSCRRRAFLFFVPLGRPRGLETL